MRPVDPAYPFLCSLWRRNDETGAVLVALVIAITLMAVLGVSLHSMSTSDTHGHLAANLSTRAGYLAESGYRYAAGAYRNAGDIFAKMHRLDTLHGTVRHLPGGQGRFSLSVHSYFFITSVSADAGDNHLSLQVPGVFPDGFTVPATLRLSIGGFVYDAGLAAQTPPRQIDVSVPAGINADLPAGTIACLVARTSGNQTLTLNAPLVLTAASAGCFPPANGRVQIGCQDPPLVYGYRSRESTPGRIVLEGLSPTDAAAGAALPLHVASGTDAILKPAITLTATGSAASGYPAGSRQITYRIPITDDIRATGLEENEALVTDTFENLGNWDAPAAGISVHQNLSTNWGVHQGGALLGGAGKSPAPAADPDAPGKQLQSIFLVLDLAAELEDAWDRGGGYLSYDVQVKHAWDYRLAAAADGICVRWHDPDGAGRYQGFGVSFMQYAGIGPAYADFIPDSIKPPALAGRPLIVLWEQAVTGATVHRRWIAWKDLSTPAPDTYILGNQWPLDGQVFNDLGSLFVRVAEETVNGIKSNRIRVFYGDASTLPDRSDVEGNAVPTDTDRWVYPPTWAAGSPGIAWPVNPLSDWRADTDRMTLTTWDAVNPAAEGYRLAADRQSITTGRFTTADDIFGGRNEIALHAFGDLEKVILFDDFSAQILGTPGGGAQSSGFAPAVQQ